MVRFNEILRWSAMTVVGAFLAATRAQASPITSTASAIAVASPAVPPVDGVELDVFLDSGDVAVVGNNAAEVSALFIQSGASLIGGTNFTPGFKALFPDTSSNTMNDIVVSAASPPGASINGALDMGHIYNLAKDFRDLQFKFEETDVNSGHQQIGAVVYVAPEPSSVCVIAVFAPGIFVRRRRQIRNLPHFAAGSA